MTARPAQDGDVLTATGISKSFGGVRALRDVGLTVSPGTICALIGPNGAGKTTLVNVLTGVYTQDAGDITFKGQDIGRTGADRRARAGMVRTFQRVRLFPQLSVLENVLAGQWSRRPFGGRPAATRERALRELEEFGLLKHAHRSPAGLTFADCRRVELVRCLLGDPALILLDEPAAGMNPEEAHRFVEHVAEIQRERDLTILLIEHNMNVVMSLASWIYVLDFGQLIAAGTPGEVRRDERVIKAYLGAGE